MNLHDLTPPTTAFEAYLLACAQNGYTEYRVTNGHATFRAPNLGGSWVEYSPDDDAYTAAIATLWDRGGRPIAPDGTPRIRSEWYDEAERVTYPDDRDEDEADDEDRHHEDWFAQ